MLPGSVLDKEWIWHEGEHRVGAAELGEATVLGRIVDGRKTSRGPAGGSHGGARELIKEGLRVARTAGIPPMSGG